MKRIIADLETNGLLPEVSTVHCLSIRDLDNEEECLSFNQQGGKNTIEAGLKILAEADEIYGHNWISYDAAVLAKLYPKFSTPAKLFDTLLIAKMRFPDIRNTHDYALSAMGRLPKQFQGRQSLKAWGYRLSCPKDDYKGGWESWSQDMESYCEQDTLTTLALVKHLAAHKAFSRMGAAIETEQVLKVILDKAQENGVCFNVEDAQVLATTLATEKYTVACELQKMFPPWEVSRGIFIPKVNSMKHGYVKGVPVERFKTIEFNPDSADLIADRLMKLFGWNPSVFTPTGKPQVTDMILSKLDYPEAKLLRRYLLLGKRLEQIQVGKQAWLRAEVGGMIHGRIDQLGTATVRASHMTPNLAQVPKNGKAYGKECRALFGPPAGWTMMGADVSGLELRVLAHFMAKHDGGAYGKTVIEGRNEDGTDVHSVNMRAAGLTDRDRAKTMIYALLYGAGDAKLGTIILPNGKATQQKDAGAKLRKKFLKNLRALGLLINDVKMLAKRRKHLPVLEGRLLPVRSEHAALNTLLQGTGAVICKRWIVEFTRRMTAEFGPQGWNGKWALMLWVHDEIQVAVRPAIAERACVIAVESIEHMTDHFSFRVPLTGEAKLGNNWSLTH